MEAEKFRSQARGGLEGSRPMMDVWSGLAGWQPGYLGRQGAAIRSRVRCFAWVGRPLGVVGGALSLCCGRGDIWADAGCRLQVQVQAPAQAGVADGWMEKKARRTGKCRRMGRVH